jgi:DNA polymerase III subunit delta'
MSFDSIIGQSLAVELCRKWLKQQTTNPLLFYGPDGVGKKMLALELAKALNCNPSPSPLQEGRGKGAATGEGLDCCDECLSCRKISAGNHPDVRVIDLAWQAAERNEPLEKQQNLRIEMIMTERHRLLQSPVEGTWKVTLLDDAHRLTADAANVLLKTLEEPPANTAIFLLTPFRDRLFATIISRCQLIRFRSLSDDEMGLCLTRMKIPSETHPHLAEMALGSPGRAVHLSREEQIEAVQKAEHLWQSLGQLSPSRVLHDAGGLSKSSKPSRGDIEQHIHSLLVPATRALRAGEADASRPIQIIQSALAQLRHNVQPALVYDNLILQLARAKS